MYVSKFEFVATIQSFYCMTNKPVNWHFGFRGGGGGGKLNFKQIGRGLVKNRRCIFVKRILSFKGGLVMK